VRLLRRFIREGATPLLILGFVACLYAVAAVGLIPFPSQLFYALAARLAQGATMFIAGCSFLENMVGFNGYFPGAFVILFAMASTHGNIPSAMRVFGAILSGAFVGQNLSYSPDASLPTTFHTNGIRSRTRSPHSASSGTHS